MIQLLNTDPIGIAKGIGDHGFMAVLTAFTIIAMFSMFRFFMSTLKKLINQQQTGAYIYETPMEQIRVLQSAVFDLTKYEVLTHLWRIHKENNLKDKPSVEKKIKDVLTNINNDRKAKLDNFKYHGFNLSSFTETSWIETITEVCLTQIYLNPDEFNYHRVFSALDIAYNGIKIEFYNNILTKS